MNLQQYYEIIKKKIENNDYTITNPREINSHIDSIIYIMWEFMLDRNDKRIVEVFENICIPTGVNTGDVNIDFKKYSVEQFLEEVMKLKD